MPDCLERIYSNAYADYIFEHRGAGEQLSDYFAEDCIQLINDRFAVAYISRADNLREQMFFDRSINYMMTPKCYGLLDEGSMEASGISAVADSAIYGYQGNGCILCVIDTGIDYTAPVFLNEDGTSRILAIWDQTIVDGPAPEYFAYGTEYTREQLNEALERERPLSLVPTEDTVGHGTILASIAAGNEVPEEGFRGAAPEADILVVKLKEAKDYLKWLYGIPTDKLAFQENDIMAGLSYCIRFAAGLRRPVSVCIGLGTSNGSHTAGTALSQMVDTLSAQENVFVSIAAGNEGNARLHYQGSGTLSQVEFQVGQDQQILTMELWGQSPDTYSVGFVTPDGAIIERIPPRFDGNTRIRFAVGGTIVNVFYTLVEAQTGNELVFIWIYQPLPGLWKLNVYGEGEVTQYFNIWMPLRQFMRPDTYFLEASPDVTITVPGNANHVTTVTSYNHRNGSISLDASRGYTADGKVKPDLAAPGVEVLGVGRHGVFMRSSGSSISAAQVAGAACLMQQWSREHAGIPLTGIQLKRYLIRGAKREPGISYPSKVWGWGKLDLLEVFDSLRRSV